MSKITVWNNVRHRDIDIDVDHMAMDGEVSSLAMSTHVTSHDAHGLPDGGLYRHTPSALQRYRRYYSWVGLGGLIPILEACGRSGSFDSFNRLSAIEFDFSSAIAAQGQPISTTSSSGVVVTKANSFAVTTKSLPGVQFTFAGAPVGDDNKVNVARQVTKVATSNINGVASAFFNKEDLSEGLWEFSVNIGQLVSTSTRLVIDRTTFLASASIGGTQSLLAANTQAVRSLDLVGEPNSLVSAVIEVNNVRNSIGSITLDAQGKGTLSLEPFVAMNFLDFGQRYPITFNVIDSLKNEAALTTNLRIAPSRALLTLDSTSDSGLYANDEVTNATTLMLSLMTSVQQGGFSLWVASTAPALVQTSPLQRASGLNTNTAGELSIVVDPQWIPADGNYQFIINKDGQGWTALSATIDRTPPSHASVMVNIDGQTTFNVARSDLKAFAITSPEAYASLVLVAQDSSNAASGLTPSFEVGRIVTDAQGAGKLYVIQNGDNALEAGKSYVLMWSIQDRAGNFASDAQGTATLVLARQGAGSLALEANTDSGLYGDGITNDPRVAFRWAPADASQLSTLVAETRVEVRAVSAAGQQGSGAALLTINSSAQISDQGVIVFAPPSTGSSAGLSADGFYEATVVRGSSTLSRSSFQLDRAAPVLQAARIDLYQDLRLPSPHGVRVLQLDTAPEAWVSTTFAGRALPVTQADSQGRVYFDIFNIANQELEFGRSYELNVMITNKAGNTADFKRDVVVAPISGKITLAAGSDSGVSNADGITKASSLELVVEAPLSLDNLSVHVRPQVADGTEMVVATGLIGTGGNDLTIPLVSTQFATDGNYQFFLYHRGQGQQEASVISQFTLTIDRTPITAPLQLSIIGDNDLTILNSDALSVLRISRGEPLAGVMVALTPVVRGVERSPVVLTESDDEKTVPTDGYERFNVNGEVLITVTSATRSLLNFQSADSYKVTVVPIDAAGNVGATQFFTITVGTTASAALSDEIETQSQHAEHNILPVVSSLSAAATSAPLQDHSHNPSAPQSQNGQTDDEQELASSLPYNGDHEDAAGLIGLSGWDANRVDVLT